MPWECQKLYSRCLFIESRKNTVDGQRESSRRSNQKSMKQSGKHTLCVSLMAANVFEMENGGVADGDKS